MSTAKRLWYWSGVRDSVAMPSTWLGSGCLSKAQRWARREYMTGVCLRARFRDHRRAESQKSRKGWDDFLWKIPGGGGLPGWVGGGWARGREVVCGELGGGVAKYFFFGAEMSTELSRKNPHAHKNKIGTSTPPSKKTQNPPLKGGILWAWGFSSRKNPKMPGAHKIGAAISGPRITGGNFMDTTLFLKKILVCKIWFYPSPPPPRKGPKWGKTVQISRKSSKLTLSRGGGAILDKTILWTSGRFWERNSMLFIFWARVRQRESERESEKD